jgi:alkaline phosphatase D
MTTITRWLVVAILFASTTNRVAADEKPISRIAFGSCAEQQRPQPIWESVVATRPELFLFLGDNIYADTEDMEAFWAKYQLLGAQPGYQKLKATCPILATWDDHDLGANDAGGEYPMKKEAQKLFLDFFGVPEESPRRRQEGVYHTQVFGPKDQRVQVILLDTRYFRGRLTTGFKPGEPGEGRRGKYAPNDDPVATVLGPKQWAWLEEQLKVPAGFRILCSSFQAVADEHGSETWGNFPRERMRLFELIHKTGAEGVVIVSGDRHLSEISRLAPDAAGIGYSIFDVTSSSLNTPCGNFTKAGTRFANEINSYRVGLTYFDTNFGFIDIDWTQPDPIIRLQVRDEKGDVVLQQRLTRSQLRPSAKQ